MIANLVEGEVKERRWDTYFGVYARRVQHIRTQSLSDSSVFSEVNISFILLFYETLTPLVLVRLSVVGCTSCPVLCLLAMPSKGEVDSGDAANEDIPPVFGNSRKIPSQISSIAHYVRKSGGRPRMLLLPVGELSLYKSFFSDRVYEVILLVFGGAEG